MLHSIKSPISKSLNFSIDKWLRGWDLACGP